MEIRRKNIDIEGSTVDGVEVETNMNLPDELNPPYYTEDDTIRSSLWSEHFLLGWTKIIAVGKTEDDKIVFARQFADKKKGEFDSSSVFDVISSEGLDGGNPEGARTENETILEMKKRCKTFEQVN